jgi:hypothetical protein
MAFSNIDTLTSITFSTRTEKDELLDWAMEEKDEAKAIRIFKVARHLK